MIYEAICRRCGETFNPTGEEASRVRDGREYVEHYATELGDECGGWGEIVGAWSTRSELPAGFGPTRAGTTSRRRAVPARGALARARAEPTSSGRRSS